MWNGHRTARPRRTSVLVFLVAASTVLLGAVGAVTAIGGPRAVCPFCEYDARLVEDRETERPEGTRGPSRPAWFRHLGGFGSAHRADRHRPRSVLKSTTPKRWSFRFPGAPRRRHLHPARTGSSLPPTVCS